jgi:uncharacterized protein
MERKTFGFKASKLTETGSFTGLLSVYGNVDSYDDVVMPGAFKDTLKEKGNQRPLLWQHNPDNPIGTLTLEDRADGLYAKGQLLLTIPQGQIAYELLKAGVLTGMSIGYAVSDGGAAFSRDGKRQLNRIDLFEGSLVTFPANDEARIDSVKKHDEIAAVLDALESNIARWKHENDVKDTVSMLFTLADVQRKIDRINLMVKEGF